MKKLAKHEKKSTDINCELHTESTTRDSLPLHKYVEILDGICTLTYSVYSFLCVVCMHAHVSVYTYIYICVFIVIHFK